jgi:hypothetical protein
VKKNLSIVFTYSVLFVSQFLQFSEGMGQIKESNQEMEKQNCSIIVEFVAAQNDLDHHFGKKSKKARRRTREKRKKS